MACNLPILEVLVGSSLQEESAFNNGPCVQESVREVAELAAALEIESEHPLADAIVKFSAETLGHSMKAQGVWLPGLHTPQPA